MEDVVIVDGLVKDYGGLRAVDGVSFKVSSGRVFGLVGSNGAGKTTMIKALTGQVRPTSGRLRVLGADPVADPVGVRSIVGIIPEQEAPPSFLTAEEYLSFVGAVRGVKDMGRHLEFWFGLLDFHGQRNMLCKDLSRGTRQKLMVAQAFVHEPKLVFIDEPLVNLDPLVQKRLKDFLRSYARAGNTVFMCTHILEVVEELCDELAVLNRGKIVASGALKDVLGASSLEEVFVRLVGGSDA
jgi:ABC-2 type transport system ATP-binding protein